MKKRSIIFISALLLLVVSVSPTLAHERQVRAAGEITVVDTGTGQITLKLRFRDSITTVQTSEKTEFLRKDKDGLEPIALTDLVAGDKVHVTGTRGDEMLQAAKVVVMPADGEPPAMVRGDISELDAAEGTLTVEPREGDPILIQTSEETQFFRTVRHGRLEQITFDDLAEGDWIKSRGEWEDEVFNASHVTARSHVARP